MDARTWPGAAERPQRVRPFRFRIFRPTGRLLGGPLLCALVLLVAGCDPEETVAGANGEATAPRPVIAATLSPAPGTVTRHFSARARAADRTALAFQVSGRVGSMAVHAGEVVRLGQVLARLEDEDYRLKVAELEGRLEAAEGRLEEARRNQRRGQTLVGDGTMSQAEFDGLDSALRQARGQRDATREALAAARSSLEDTVLRAPFEAHVVARRVEPFEQVDPQRVVFVLDRLDPIELVVGLPEAVAARRPLPRTVEVRFPAAGIRTEARVQALVVDVQDTQVYPLRLHVDNPEGRILPGMTGQVELPFPSQEGEDGFLVPVTALFDHQGRPHVWLLDPEDGRVHRRAVHTGPVERDGVLIRGELEAGARVVTAGVTHLREGQRVTPVTRDELRETRR